METTYTRISLFFQALDFLHNCDEWVPNLCNIAKRSSHKVELAVNWWSIGTVGTGRAREAARQIEIVSAIADRVNTLDLEWVMEDDKYITTSDSYGLYLDVIVDAIRNGSCEAIEAFFKTIDHEEGIPGGRYWEPEDDRTEEELMAAYEPADDEQEPLFEDEFYTPSATHGDYSPSCPWNAPGMSISDFI